MKNSSVAPRVLYVGDSKEMKGGVCAVMNHIIAGSIWEKYNCRWLECQINASTLKKIQFLLCALFKGVFVIPSYDIIHFQTSAGNSLKVQLPFFLYSLILRKKTVIQFHVGNQLRDHSSDPLLKFYCKHCNVVVTLGESLKQYVPVSVSGRPEVICLYNPAPEIIQKTGSEKFFLFAAYIDPERNKGYDVLLEAFSIFVKTHHDWKLVICGVGDIAQLESLIKANGLESYVDLPGWVDGEIKRSYFKNARAYCMCSRKEGLPMSVLEAMSYGLPVITTPVGSLPEFLVDGENSLYYDFEDSRALAECLSRIADDDDLCRMIGLNAQKLIEEMFSCEVYSSRLDSLYSGLVTSD